jgi:hypothetical protein
MKVSIGDIFDKWSILRMKVKLSEDVREEYEEYVKELAGIPLNDSVFDLIEINSKMWILEADIRNGKEMPLEEVGKRALQIRDLNKIRIEAKNKINEIFGDYQEIKINHASERTT